MYMPADAYAYLDTLFQNSCPFQALALPPPPLLFVKHWTLEMVPPVFGPLLLGYPFAFASWRDFI